MAALCWMGFVFRRDTPAMYVATGVLIQLKNSLLYFSLWLKPLLLHLKNSVFCVVKNWVHTWENTEFVGIVNKVFLLLVCITLLYNQLCHWYCAQTLVTNNRRIYQYVIYLKDWPYMAVNWAYCHLNFIWRESEFDVVVWHLCGLWPSYLIGMFHQLERTLSLSTLRTMVSVTEVWRKWAVFRAVQQLVWPDGH